jgi:hypothetical protein
MKNNAIRSKAIILVISMIISLLSGISFFSSVASADTAITLQNGLNGYTGTNSWFLDDSNMP